VAPLTVDQIAALVDGLGDMATALGEGNHADRAAVYQQAGL
jgi:hypothetical protein